MKQIFFALLAVFIMGVRFSMASPGDPELVKLADMADEALHYSKVERYEEAKKVLTHMENILEDTDGLNPDELRAVTASYVEAAALLDKENFTNEEAVNSLMKLRLAVDAVITEHEPLWTNMEADVLEAFQNVKERILRQDQENFHRELNHFLSVYDIIYPSVMIDVPVEQVQKVNAQIQYLERYSFEFFGGEADIGTVEVLERDLESLFDHTEEDEADPSLWWVIISTGGIILITLSYVGWKKYRAEQEYRKRRKHELKN